MATTSRFRSFARHVANGAFENAVTGPHQACQDWKTASAHVTRRWTALWGSRGVQSHTAGASASAKESAQATAQTPQGAHEKAVAEPDTPDAQGDTAAGPTKDGPAGPAGGAASSNTQQNFSDMLRDARSISAEVAATMWRRATNQAPGSGGRNAGTAAKDWVNSVGRMAGFRQKRGTNGSGEGGEGGPTGEQAQADFVKRMRTEVARAVLPEWNMRSVMKRRTDVNAREIQVGEGPADLVVQEVPESWMDKLTARLGNSALAKRIAQMRESDAMRSVAEGYHTVREKLEQGDSEVVNRMSEMRERLMTESEGARAYREIRMRHPDFDMPSFLRAIKSDVPVIIKAYLTGDVEVLKEYCSDAMLERLAGIHKVTVAQGQIADPTILEYSDVDIVDMKMLESDPVVILHFSCQQINCVRDTYGNVTSGSPDEVNRVYYYWAVQMDGHGMVTDEGQYIPPRWKLVEMLLRGMHQLL